MDARKRACDAEGELNRRLAPDIYLGVVPVVCKTNGALGFGGEETLVDWAVHAPRARQRTRGREARDGDPATPAIDAIADRLVSFHAASRRDEATGEFGSTRAIGVNIAENFAQKRQHLDGLLASGEAREIESWQRAFVRNHESLFQARVARGRVRDGHGDLRLEHVYLGPHGEMTILDCIEFNERFRFADVCADVAFLAMDLAWHVESISRSASSPGTLERRGTSGCIRSWIAIRAFARTWGRGLLGSWGTPGALPRTDGHG